MKHPQLNDNSRGTGPRATLQEAVQEQDLQGRACQDNQVSLIVPLPGFHRIRALVRRRGFGKPATGDSMHQNPKNLANRANLVNPAHILLIVLIL